jgi:hypothetical protein
MDLYPPDNVTVTYHGRDLMCPSWLVPLLPDEEELPLKAWPTFCGAGDGFGDWIVRDKICGCIIKPVCFVHDVGWACSEEEGDYFVRENWRFRHNLVAWVVPNLPWWRKANGYTLCYLYWLAVATLGQKHFAPCGTDWATNPVVFEKLQRLARATIGIV